jgi:cobyrinic acid a,c-diamide synthase
MPIYAECGGLMFLTASITDLQGKQHAMVGVVPGRARMRERLVMGYRTVTASRDTLLLPVGERTRGHEFHYSDWVDRPADLPHAYEIAPRMKEGARPEGLATGNLLASYVHLHFASQTGLARRFVEASLSFQTLGETGAPSPARK